MSIPQAVFPGGLAVLDNVHVTKYGGILAVSVEALLSPAGAVNVSSVAVPTNQAYSVHLINAFDPTNAITALELGILSGGIFYQLAVYGILAAAVRGIWYGRLELGPTEQLQARFTGVTLNDTLYLRYHGYKLME
jgi:hypothetical protein